MKLKVSSNEEDRIKRNNNEPTFLKSDFDKAQKYLKPLGIKIPLVWLNPNCVTDLCTLHNLLKENKFSFDLKVLSIILLEFIYRNSIYPYYNQAIISGMKSYKGLHDLLEFLREFEKRKAEIDKIEIAGFHQIYSENKEMNRKERYLINIEGKDLINVIFNSIQAQQNLFETWALNAPFKDEITLGKKFDKDNSSYAMRKILAPILVLFMKDSKHKFNSKDEMYTMGGAILFTCGLMPISEKVNNPLKRKIFFRSNFRKALNPGEK